MITTQVGRMLDEEHRSNLELLERVERAVGRAPESTPDLAALLGRFAHAMEHDIDRHFRFEEEVLFPLLAEAGDGAMAALLAEEHQSIRDVTEEMLPWCGTWPKAAATRSPGTGCAWRRWNWWNGKVAHIQKETMALLPLLEDLLDAETDGQLALDYAATA